MLAKSTSLFLSFFLLMQSFNIHFSDVSQLSTLLKHIEFHESTYGDDIFSFIAKHYGDKVTEHEKQQEKSKDHQRLPFHHNICVDTVPLFLFETSFVRLVLSESLTLKKRSFFYHNFYSFLENTDILQPPQMA